MSKPLAGRADDDPRWRRIEAYVLDDPGASLPFSHRLARENGWSLYYAGRVIAEYRKFCFLAIAAGHGVTPSDEVDQAWHLHLLYTRDYWDRFCPEALGQPLHHGPTRGGAADGERFREWYERTMESYRRAFGRDPPADIWPAAEERFANAPHMQRIDRSAFWLIRRPRWAVRRR